MDERIEALLDRFDFEAVKKVMVALGWEWGCGAGAHIPTYNEMRQLAKELLEDAAVYGPASGGFEARDEDGVLSLAFVAVQDKIEYGGEE